MAKTVLLDLTKALDINDAEELAEEVTGLAEDLIEAGADETKTIGAIAGFLDHLIPMDVLVPGPAGVAAEAVDGPAIEWLLTRMRDLLRVDPEKQAARQARRKARREARRAARRDEG